MLIPLFLQGVAELVLYLVILENPLFFYLRDAHFIFSIIFLVLLYVFFEQIYGTKLQYVRLLVVSFLVGGIYITFLHHVLFNIETVELEDRIYSILSDVLQGIRCVIWRVCVL